MKDRVAMLDASEIYRPEISIKNDKNDHKYRRFTFDVCYFFIQNRLIDNLFNII